MLGCKEEQRLRDHNVWKQILAPSLILSVTLSEFSKLLEPQFLHCKMGLIIELIAFIGLLQRLNMPM